MKILLMTLLCGLLVACGGSDPNDGGDGGADADSDTDTDSDSDTDGDTCENPEVAQDGTSLFWQRCPVGQCVVDDVCIWPNDQDAGAADAITFEWIEAQDACEDPYRIPTIHEMADLLGNCDDIVVDENTPAPCTPCPDSPDCDGIFPEIDNYADLAWENVHWSSTEMNVSNAWRANFKTGMLDPFSMTSKGTVICVREE